MIALLTALMPIAIKIIGAYLDSIGARAETKRQFISFIQEMESKGPQIPKLMNAYKNQKEKLLKKIKENKDV